MSVEEQNSDFQDAVELVFGPPPEATAPSEERGTPETDIKKEPKVTDENEEKAKIEALKHAEIERWKFRKREREAQRIREIQEKERILAERESKLKEVEPDLEKARKLREYVNSPTKLLELADSDPKEFLEKLANENEPDALIERIRNEFRSEIEGYKKELESIRKAQEEREIRAQRQQHELMVKQAQDAFVESVAKEVEKYPFLTDEFTPDEIAQRGYNVVQEFVQKFGAQYGREPYQDEMPSDSEVAEYLEAQAKSRYESKQAWRQRIGKAAPQSVDFRPGDKQPKPTVKADVPRTLTSRAASSKTVKPKEWTQEGADEESLAYLTEALKKLNSSAG